MMSKIVRNDTHFSLKCIKHHGVKNSNVLLPRSTFLEERVLGYTSSFSNVLVDFELTQKPNSQAWAMAEEKAPASASELEQTLDPNQTSIEATESTCNNNNAAESETTLEFADELTEKGSVFLKESDFAEAVDCFSRALEIRLFFI